MEYGGYNVFVRTWWRKTATGREPGAGKRRYLAKGVSEERARALCAEYNASHEPGFLSKKAEYERA